MSSEVPRGVSQVWSCRSCNTLCCSCEYNRTQGCQLICDEVSEMSRQLCHRKGLTCTIYLSLWLSRLPHVFCALKFLSHFLVLFQKTHFHFHFHVFETLFIRQVLHLRIFLKRVFAVTFPKFKGDGNHVWKLTTLFIDTQTMELTIGLNAPVNHDFDSNQKTCPLVNPRTWLLNLLYETSLFHLPGRSYVTNYWYSWV